MKVFDILRKYNNIEIELLLAYVLRKPKEFIFLHPETRLTRIQADRLMRVIKRRQKGEPIAYIFGYKDFYGLRFNVDKNVLIPRPETEGLVEEAVLSIKYQVLRENTKTIEILDVGTGSGCIAIAIANKLNAISYKLRIIASDISEKALKVASENAKAHHVNINFIQSDLLDKIKFNPDIIIANLPYGWSEWKNNTSVETAGLKFEPKEALFAKGCGLYQISRLLGQIAKRKIKPKLVLLEFDPRQKRELSKVIKKKLPGGEAEFYKDFNGLWRNVIITL